MAAAAHLEREGSCTSLLSSEFVCHEVPRGQGKVPGLEMMTPETDHPPSTPALDAPCPLQVTAPAQRSPIAGSSPVMQGRDIRARPGSTHGFYHIDDPRGLGVGDLLDVDDSIESTRGLDRQLLPGAYEVPALFQSG